MPARSKSASHLMFFASRWLVATGLGCALGGCGPEAVPLRLTLVAAPEFPVGLRSLRVVVREAARDRPDVYGPFALRDDFHIALAVRPGEPFYADILGCGDRDVCDEENVIARGCTAVVKVERSVELKVTLHGISTAEAAACPPELP
ncbi:MAG: hypothetical protein ACO3JL_15630 [Myxococcota bacterium]